MVVDIAQYECSNIERYASAFSNIQICKNYFKIVEKKKDWNDMVADVA